MPGRMPEDMPEDLPATKCINVMVGITRSKVFFLWCSWPMSWKPKFVLLGRAVCILVPEWSVQWYDALQLNLTSTKPSVQLELLPVYCFLVSLRGCCVALSSVTRSFQVFLVLSNTTGSCTLVFTFFWNQGWWLWTSEAQNPLAV